MEDIYNTQNVQQEKYQSIKPEINFFLIIVSSFLWAFVIWIIINQFLGIFSSLVNTLGSALIIILISFIISFVIVFFFKLMNLKKTEYKFYSNRVEYYEGFLVKNRKTINFDRISNIGQRKGILEGLFKLGTIYIDTAGSSKKGHELAMKYLKNPDQVYDWISRVTSREK